MDLEIMRHAVLFAGLSVQELENVLTCITAAEQHYTKGELLLLAGDPVSSMGLVLYGRVQVAKETRSGGRELMAGLSAGQLFGESFVCAGAAQSPVTVTAAEDCGVLWVDVSRLLAVCPSSCPFHHRLVQNIVSILAEKNLYLNEKITYLSKRTLRKKLMAYFEQEAGRQGGRTLCLPFTREELADFLCVDRSALSRELSHMRQEGLLDVAGREIRLL